MATRFWMLEKERDELKHNRDFVGSSVYFSFLFHITEPLFDRLQ